MAIINSVTIHHRWFVSSIIEDFNGHYELIRKLGRGAFGQVFLARHRTTSDLKAIKCFEKTRIENVQSFKIEVKMLRDLTHANIMKIHEIYESDDLCCIISDYLSGGELLNRVRSERSLSEQYASFIMRKLLGAISYCHSQGVCHRDLKPENILLVSPSAESDIKIIDFGISQSFTENQFLHHFAGSPHYIAPEILTGNYTNAVDCWSLGVILYYMLSGLKPFNGNSRRELIENIYNGYFDFSDPVFGGISNGAKDLIARLLIKDPELRISADKAFQHPWVRGLSPLPDIEIDSSIFDRMNQFAQADKMQKITMMYIAIKVSEIDLEHVKVAFEALDADGNGILSPLEFRYGLENSFLKLDEEFMQAVWGVLDCNKNGGLDYVEFIALCLDCQTYSDDYYIEIAFRYFDKNNDGLISREELILVLDFDTTELSNKIAGIIKEVDLNQDGVIDYAEFLNMMKKLN